MKILLVFESKYGSTAEIAERIGQGLTDSGIDVFVCDAREAPTPDSFDAVIIGSAVYIGRWRKNVSKYLVQHRALLSQKRVWLFSSGPTGEGDAVQLLQGWKHPKNLEESIRMIQPVAINVFHGAVFLDRVRFLDKWLAQKVESPIGDFRDFSQIDQYAATIAAAL